MKQRFLLSFFLASSAVCVFGWGQKGHDTVAYIAENHLTPAAKTAVDSILEGKTMVYWANWLDNASHSQDYAYTKTWHYKNIDEGLAFEDAPNIPEGNIVEAIYSQTDVLTDPEASTADKNLALKMVIHFLGDIHQPMHMGRATDRGGNYHKVKFFSKPTNLHSVWDTDILEAAHAWSHTEWQREIDLLPPMEEEAIIMEGNPETWGKETYGVCSEIYSATPEGQTLSYDYIAAWTSVIESQLLKGGLRLADVLNSIFDPDYIPLNSFLRK